MTRVHDVVIGLVKDINDPDGLGRVRVQFPWLDDTELSGWARIARTMAGKDRGFYYMPELEDEALVAFEHGDVRFPYVIGFLHNGVDLPPDQGIDAEVRRVKTVSGHILEFDDRAGRQRITLKTHSGHQLEMKDAAGTVELRTNGGQKIVMRDGPGQIALSTSRGTAVTIDDSDSAVRVATVGGTTVQVTDAIVTVDAPTAILAVNCLTAMVEASTFVNVDAAIINFNSPIATFSGVVQCEALIADAVVSTSYTPGAGNLI